MELGAVDSVEALAALLRQLRRRAARQRGDSQLTYRELAASTGWAHGVIGDYFAGKTLPPTDRFDALVRLLGAAGPELGALATARDRVEERRRARMQQAAAPAAAGGGPGSGPRPRPGAAPRELPPDPPVLVGRDRELASLDLLRPLAPPGPSPIAALDGPGGVGKSALAVHAAHLLADRFPDGQLYADLRGADCGLSPLAPATVLARFLRSLGAEGPLPVGEAGAGALYRALAADRRLLVVLDNAYDAAQVRPLLPAAPGCAVLVTSRRVLATVDGAVHRHVGLLTMDQSLALLGAYAGERRLAADRPAAEETVRCCGYLPLALRIAGARLAARPRWPVRALADRLADPRRRLDELEYADLRVRFTFEAGYQCLLDGGETDHLAAETLPVLAEAEGELTAGEAARLTHRAAREAEPVLERLVDAQLLESPGPGRYRFHPLLRLFALEQAGLPVLLADRPPAAGHPTGHGPPPGRRFLDRKLSARRPARARPGEPRLTERRLPGP
ncbi:NB-ARC domain-containing protein [Streptomyces sp. NPDC050617]|uniref:NB-ARC domain-containing protein n=1 Tax=Streptomyces sp. NPDC050617 TaxID=3154628 RepID=UPI003416B893